MVASHREYWLVHKTSDTDESSTPHSKKRAAMDLKRTRILEVKKKLYPRDDTATLGSIKDVLYAVKKTVNGQTLGYIRLFSFDVDDHDAIRQGVHQADHQGRIFRRTVSSWTFAAIRVETSALRNRCCNCLRRNRIEPELFEFINTPLNFQICKSAPDHWDLKRWLPSIGESVLTGATYSAGFPLTRDAVCNGIGQVYYGPVVLITDALSYSATDIFAAGFQDNEVGLVLGTSGNTGAGGANFWSLDDLLRAQKKDPKSPFKTLPKGAEMIVAMRRSIRVGLRAGSPLEEFGVSPDELHFMTRRDILEDNCDLLASAARIIRQQAVVHAVGHAGEPQRCARDCGERRVEASLVQGGPGDLPRRYLRRTIGPCVPSTLATARCHRHRSRSARRASKPATVEVGAWDHAGRLVAFRRTAVR